MYYTSDIPIDLNSTIQLFTDDTIAYLAIESTIDAKHLHKGLDKLAKWEVKWKWLCHSKLITQSNLPTPSMVIHNRVMRKTQIFLSNNRTRFEMEKPCK